MSTDLSGLFATVRAEADRVLLAPAAALRRQADRRARRRALGIACGALAAVVLVVGVSFAAARLRTAAPMPPAGASSSAPVVPPSPSPAPSPTSPPSSPPSSSPSASSGPPATYRACTAKDLSYVSKSVGGAMGSIGDTYTMRSKAADTCQLSGAPVVTYVNSGGTRVDLPAEPDSSTHDPVVVQPGATATFWLLRPGEAAGNVTSGPTCVHNGVYPNLAIRLPDGTSVLLGGNSLQVWCGDISIGTWQLG